MGMRKVAILVQNLPEGNKENQQKIIRIADFGQKAIHRTSQIRKSNAAFD
jgi:hypothetical protein